MPILGEITRISHPHPLLGLVVGVGIEADRDGRQGRRAARAVLGQEAPSSGHQGLRARKRVSNVKREKARVSKQKEMET